MPRIHSTQQGYTAGQAALILGLTIRELDRQVELGRITPTRTPGGKRRFAHSDVHQLAELLAEKEN